MGDRLKKILMQRLSIRESWVIFFVLGIIMMNFPFLSIFNKAVYLHDLPALYLYLQLGWIISIFVIFVFTKANHTERDRNRKTGEPE